MSTNTLFIMCCVIIRLSLGIVETTFVPSVQNIKVVQQETQHLEGTVELALNENSISVENCMRSLIQIPMQPLRTTDCCLTKLCSDNYLQNQITAQYPRIKELLVFKLCSDNLYLLKEQFSGCCSKNNLNSYVNNDTNFTSMTSDKTNAAITNCSVNLQAATINDETAEINSKITTNSEKRSTETFVTSTLASSFKSEPYIETSNSLEADKKIRFENITETSARSFGLQFLDVPKGDDMRIHDLRLDEEYLLFEAFTSLMGYLQPTGFPAELVVDALKSRIPFQLLAFQILKLEIVVIAWIILWAMVSVCLPLAVAANLCCSSNIRRLDEDGSINFRDRCTENTLGFLLHVLLVLLLCPILLILAGNEQISKSISRSNSATNIIYEDIYTFIRNTHMQISFVTTSSTDIAIEAIRKDLEDVVNLLGQPYQQELASETGIDIALDALNELKISTAKVTMLVKDLLNECATARTAGTLLQEQLRDISRQLTITRQQCSFKDRALCYTLQYSGFDVVFSTDNFTTDTKIKQLDLIGTEENFNNSVDNAHRTFQDIPDRVSMETVSSITEIKTLLSRKRTEVYKSTHSLDVLTRSLSESVRSSEDSVSHLIQEIVDWDLWRWLAVLGITTILSLIWGLLVCGAPCGCGLTSRTIPFLISGVSLSCLICVFVWSLATITFLVGGHGQSLLCQPLYDTPYYRTLTELLDSGGVLYNAGGFFKHFNKGNDTVEIDKVLNNCQRDQPVYTTFHLHNQLDVNKVTNYQTWQDLKSLFSNFSIEENHMEILTPSLQLNLQILSTATNVNLTSYREQISLPITKRDLGSFADQLNTVARQLNDPLSSRKIDHLAYNVRKVVNNELQKLIEIRKRLVYKITTLEVLLHPLNKQTNQSLSHLKTIQFFLDNRGWEIAKRTSKKFTARIESNLQDLYNHVNSKVTKEIGKCRPLWEIFHSTRFYVCKLIIDPMNGISFSSFFLILLFVIIAPVVVKLVDYYKEGNEDILSSISHRRTRDGLIIDDEGTWATPSSTPPEATNNAAVAATAEAQTWTSPRPSEVLIPPAPRPPSSNISSRIQSPRLPQIPSLSRAKTPKSKLSTIASRITGARIPQMPSVSRARSPKRGRDSLRLIEPICWKTGSTTPGNWI